MKELICEMCGSNNIIKQDGLFVCQACNTKYSIEEARKMMAGEVVEVEGTVKIDDSSQLSNLFELARRAIRVNNYDDALRYYDQILMKSPNDWESQFNVLYCKAKTCQDINIGIVGNSMSDSIHIILELIKENVPHEKHDDILEEISLKVFDVVDDLAEKSKNYYWSFKDASIRKNHRKEFEENLASVILLSYNFGDCLMDLFDGEYSGYAVRSWIKGIEIQNQNRQYLGVKIKDLDNNYMDKIHQYQPDYEFKSNGCFVATSVYGSYDCPEVWTLRRFRDNSLNKSLFGRLFIKMYYATSPTIVKYFGDKKLFNNIFKPILDIFVNKLKEKGYESTYYNGN